MFVELSDVDHDVARQVKPWLEEGTDADAAHPSEAHASLAHPAAGEEATECSEHEANEEEGKQDGGEVVGGEVVGDEVTEGSFKSTGQAGDGVERDAPLSSVSKGTPDRLKVPAVLEALLAAFWGFKTQLLIDTSRIALLHGE